MKKFRNIRFASLFLAAALAVSSAGSQAEPVATGLETIEYTVDMSSHPTWMTPEKIIKLIESAAEAWEPCGVVFKRREILKGREEPYELVPQWGGVVFFGNLTEVKNAGQAWIKSELGGRVVDWSLAFDIESMHDRRDLTGVAIHEFGHVIGMAHSQDRRSAMHSSHEHSADKVMPEDIEACKAARAKAKALKI